MQNKLKTKQTHHNKNYFNKTTKWLLLPTIHPTLIPSKPPPLISFAVQGNSANISLLVQLLLHLANTPVLFAKRIYMVTFALIKKFKL